MRIVIIANGEPPTKDDVQPWLTDRAVLICADGGGRTALTMNLKPHHVIGDFDSLSEDELRELEQGGAQLHHYSPRKDETDLELALLFAVKLFATKHTKVTEKRDEPLVLSASTVADEVVVLGARGGRIDHELANMLLLAMPALSGVPVLFAHGVERLFLIDARDQAVQRTLHGCPGDIVSLLPFGGDAHGIETEGLEYSLRDESLFVGPARGVSNVMLGDEACVSLRQGMLLCVITRQE